MIISTILSGGLLGCLSCNPDLRSAILDHRFTLLLLTIAPVTLIGGVVAGWVATMLARRFARHAADALAVIGPSWPAWPAAVTGAGLGALFDGILLHELLQVHDMISNSLPPVTVLDKGVNVFWSGVFDLSVFALIMIGIAGARRQSAALGPAPDGFFWGCFLIGWGTFNCYDVLTFHALLRYHDVVEVTTAPLAWNLAWAVLGVIIVAIGVLLMRRRRTRGARGATASG